MGSFEMSLENLPNIMITGTPGVGKTSLSMLLADRLNELIQGKTSKTFTHINIGSLVNDKKLYKEWNEEFDVPEFEEDMIVEELQPPLMRVDVSSIFTLCTLFLKIGSI